MSKVKCDHCRLEFDKDVMIEETIDGQKRYFCCKGCQGVYHLLKSEGLDSFYDKLGDQVLEPAKEVGEDLEKFDLEGFTHNMQQVTRVSDYTDFMYLGKFIELGETEEFFINPKVKLSEEYITGKFG